jgi:hypothetical protein
MRRNKIQNFITNLKQTKGTPSLKNETNSFSSDQDSFASLNSFDPPPSYCSAESPRSPEPYPQSLDHYPESQPTLSLNHSSSNEKKQMSSKSSHDKVLQRNSKEKKHQPTRSAAFQVTGNSRESHLQRGSPRNGSISRSPIEYTEPKVSSTRSKSAPRGTSRPPKPPTQTQTPDGAPTLRREKMRSLEEAAKARVQSKKDRENEMKRSFLFLLSPSFL